jgi:NitT/TauT family transport system permease protein
MSTDILTPTLEKKDPTGGARTARTRNLMDFLIIATGVAGFAVSFFDFYGVGSTNGQVHLTENAWHGWSGWIAAVLLLVSAVATGARVANLRFPHRDEVVSYAATGSLVFSVLALLIHPGHTFPDGSHFSAHDLLNSTPAGSISWSWAAWTLAGLSVATVLLISFSRPEPAVRRKRRILILAGQLTLVVVILGLWQWLSTGGEHAPLPEFEFGHPTNILTGDATDGGLRWYINAGTEFGPYLHQIIVTMREAFLGFLGGTLAGVVAGVLLGQNAYLADVFSPYIKIVNAVPRIVLGSIFLIAFGLGEFPKMLLAGVLVFFVVFFNAFQGVREVDQNVISNARVLGASRWDITRHVTIPSAMTWIIASVHTAFGFAIVGVIVGEVLGAQAGLGLVIATAQGHFQADGVFAVMGTVAAIVLVAESLLTKLEHRLLSWRPPSRSDNASI